MIQGKTYLIYYRKNAAGRLYPKEARVNSSVYYCLSVEKTQDGLTSRHLGVSILPSGYLYRKLKVKHQKKKRHVIEKRVMGEGLDYLGAAEDYSNLLACDLCGLQIAVQFLDEHRSKFCSALKGFIV